MHEDVDSIAANIAEWTEANAEHTDANAARAWTHPGILWGVLRVSTAGSPRLHFFRFEGIVEVSQVMSVVLEGR